MPQAQQFGIGQLMHCTAFRTAIDRNLLTSREFGNDSSPAPAIRGALIERSTIVDGALPPYLNYSSIFAIETHFLTWLFRDFGRSCRAEVGRITQASESAFATSNAHS